MVSRHPAKFGGHRHCSSIIAVDITSDFLEAGFLKFYLIHSLILLSALGPLS